MAQKAKKPSFKVSWRFERRAHEAGHQLVAGVDEVGRGPLAGPVVVAAVIFSPGVRVNNLADSKCLAPDVRVKIARRIRQKAFAYALGMATAEEIDRINIYQATLLAARRAVEALPVAPDYFITDYLRFPWTDKPTEPLVHGDARCASVAAASIIAKVARDAMMRRYDEEYPGYGFASHKGYTCPAHLGALNELGPTTLHRLTFNGVSWFDIQPRPSRTFARFSQALETIAAEAEVDLLRAQLAALDPPLPECECQTLDSLFCACAGRFRRVSP